MTKAQIWLSAIVGVFAVVAFFHWITLHGRELEKSYIQYEACVKKEYGMTPTRWYADHGQYPECELETSE